VPPAIPLAVPHRKITARRIHNYYHSILIISRENEMPAHYSEVYRRFGNIICEFYGNGELTFDNSARYSCEFCVFQTSDGSTYFAIEILPPGTAYSPNSFDRNFSFKGVTESGKIVIVKPEDFMLLQRLFAPLIYRIHKFKILRINFNRIKNIKFSVVNFLFTGNDSTQKTISLKLQGKTPILIQKVSDYSDKENSLKGSLSIDITSELVIILNNPQEIAEAINLANEICCLLSICRGSRVSWINYSISDENGGVMYQIFCNYITRPLSELPELISHESRAVYSTKSFIETAYSTISLNDPLKESLLRFCNVFTEARDGRGFTESRGVKIVVLMEMLKEYTLNNPIFEINREILNPSKEKTAKDQMLTLCKDVISIQIDTLDDIKYVNRWCLPSSDLIDYHYKLLENQLYLKNNLSGLNRVSFKKILIRLCEKLEVPVTSHEIKQFVDSRNSLIHTGCFYCELHGSNTDHATWKEYQFLVCFLDKVFLRLFGYSGKFQNFQNWGKDLEDTI
jgi:hypothetical protein